MLLSLASLWHLAAALGRNAAEASGSTVHSAAYLALTGLLWNSALESARRAQQAAHGDPDAFRDSMANDLGMSREEFDYFWDHFGPQDEPSDSQDYVDWQDLDDFFDTLRRR